MSMAVPRGTVVSNGGSEAVYSGGIASGTRIGSGGGEYVVGGTTSAAIVSSGGFLLVQSGGAIASGTLSGGQIEIQSGIFATTLTFSGGGILRPGDRSTSAERSPAWPLRPTSLTSTTSPITCRR